MLTIVLGSCVKVSLQHFSRKEKLGFAAAVISREISVCNSKESM
jgi:hypothetical protein